MAKKTIHLLVDDLDGSEADESVKFAIDGRLYEIDLSEKNATKLRKALAPYMDKAQPIGRVNAIGTVATHQTRGGTRSAGRNPGSDRDQLRAIREWAASKGIKVSDRGRIKQEIVDRFNAEAGQQLAS